MFSRFTEKILSRNNESPSVNNEYEVIDVSDNNIRKPITNRIANTTRKFRNLSRTFANKAVSTVKKLPSTAAATASVAAAGVYGFNSMLQNKTNNVIDKTLEMLQHVPNAVGVPVWIILMLTKIVTLVPIGAIGTLRQLLIKIAESLDPDYQVKDNRLNQFANNANAVVRQYNINNVKENNLGGLAYLLEEDRKENEKIQRRRENYDRRQGGSKSSRKNRRYKNTRKLPKH